MYAVKDNTDWKLQSILDQTACGSTICALLAAEEVIFRGMTKPLELRKFKVRGNMLPLSLQICFRMCVMYFGRCK